MLIIVNIARNKTTIAPIDNTTPSKYLLFLRFENPAILKNIINRISPIRFIYTLTIVSIPKPNNATVNKITPTKKIITLNNASVVFLLFFVTSDHLLLILIIRYSNYNI